MVYFPEPVKISETNNYRIRLTRKLGNAKSQTPVEVQLPISKIQFNGITSERDFERCSRQYTRSNENTKKKGQQVSSTPQLSPTIVLTRIETDPFSNLKL